MCFFGRCISFALVCARGAAILDDKEDVLHLIHTNIRAQAIIITTDKQKKTDEKNSD